MNILAVGAHFDDVEMGCSGTLIKYAEQGAKVIILVVTDSAYQNPTGENVRNADLALKEGKRAAEIIGADLLCLGRPTLQVKFEEDLTKEIHHTIEKFAIDSVFCHWTDDLHRDHQNTAKCTTMAARHVPRMLMYRSNYYDSLEVFKGVVYSDISRYIEKKKTIIKTHRSELERVRYKWLDFICRQNANDGQRIGVDFAEKFDIIRYLI